MAPIAFLVILAAALAYVAEASAAGKAKLVTVLGDKVPEACIIQVRAVYCCYLSRILPSSLS